MLRLLLLLSILLLPAVTSAHFLKTDGSIGAIIHITPDDDPVAGEVSALFFDIKDREDKFRVEDCDCELQIFQNGTSLFSESLLTNGDDVSASYTFPNTGVYEVKLSGAPINSQGFQSFNLSWDIRVDRGAGGNQNSYWRKTLSQLNGHGLHLALIVGASIGMLIYIALENKKEKQRKQKG